MRLHFVDIRNFKKLKSCRVEFSKQKTLFVGSNNSGKTSAMNALILFLGNQPGVKFTVTDFTLCNWKKINQIGESWEQCEEPDKLDFSSEEWRALVPSLDVWFNVEDSEIHYVSHLIPTLSWKGGLLGVRLVFEPKELKDLYKDYVTEFRSARAVEEGNNRTLWPKSLYDYLKKKLGKHFSIKAYILDPKKALCDEPQELPKNSSPIEGNPLIGLVKVDTISAQRGFIDSTNDEGASQTRKLSKQLQEYFKRHLDPSEFPNSSDVAALEAIEEAQAAFEDHLQKSFQASLDELTDLNYPGFSNPDIYLTAKMEPLRSLEHDAAVQFRVNPASAGDSDDEILVLPEHHNGLGYQNLISMIFSLIRFRDEWMKVGKEGKRSEISGDRIEPLHLVMIEEPEAHLHPQAQQVFVRKAYDVLRKHERLQDNNRYSTQLIISTHSSHIAHEVDFVDLRYFRRMPAADSNEVPCSTVINLSGTFGNDEETLRFVTRYLRSTHCDLFFADAAILVEGSAERILMPHFIRSHFPTLNRNYISILEIGGSHAHRLKPLLDRLGLLTLIITDLDSASTDKTKKPPKKGIGYITTNSTIKTWLPEKSGLDDILNAMPHEKISDAYVRIAYQYELTIDYDGSEAKVIPYTFEDALALSNVELFRKMTNATGLLKKLVNALSKETASEACKTMFDELQGNSKKAEMALDLLFTTDPKELSVPEYISEGLEWLETRLNEQVQDYVTSGKEEPTHVAS